MRQYSKLQTKGWTPERRTLQAIRVRQYKPWLRSTGPKTIEGKRKVSMNAIKHGLYGPQARAIKSYFAASRFFLRMVEEKSKQMEYDIKVLKELQQQKAKGIVNPESEAIYAMMRSRYASIKPGKNIQTGSTCKNAYDAAEKKKSRQEPCSHPNP